MFHISWHWIIMSWIIDVCYDECMHTMGVEYEICILEKDQYFCHHHRRPTFYEPYVTKQLVMQSTTRHQKKDMDPISLLIPNKSKWFGCNSILAATASQSQAFFRNDIKCWKWSFSASCKIPLFWKLFFKTMLLKEESRYDMKPKPRETWIPKFSENISNFLYLQRLLRYFSMKVGLLLW